MKRILLLIAAVLTFSTLFSQNVNYTVQIVSYGALDTPCTSDGFGFDEEVTWKCWGMDDGNIPSMIGGTCEGRDNNVPMTFTPADPGFVSTVLINETNTPASNLTIQLEAWEDDNVSNSVGSVDRCTFGSGDDCHVNEVFPAFNFRNEPHCQWNNYSFTSGDFRVTIRVKWELAEFSVVDPINGCDNQAQLFSTGSGEWSIVSGAGGSFTNQYDTNAVMNGNLGETYQLNWSYLPNCITTSVPPLNVTVNMLPNPVPGLTTTSDLCENGNLVFTASNGVNYIWSTGTVGNIIDTTTNGLDTIFNVTSGDLPVFVTVTDANGCSATESWSSVLTAGPPVDLGNDTSICVGTTATLDAWDPTPYSYSWNNGEVASIIYPSTGGQYIVTVTDFASGCSGYDTVQVSLFPASQLFLGNDIEFCLGDTVILDAGSNFASYDWSTGTTNQTETITGFGEVSIITIDTNTCVLMDTINFSPTYTYSALTTDTVIFLGNSIVLTSPSGSSYSWSTGESTQEITVAPTENTNYVVTLQQANGCFDVLNVNVLISDRLNLFIPTMFSPNGDKQNDFFLLYGNGIATINFSIYNRWGELVYQVTGDDAVMEIQTIGWNGKHNEIEQPVGTYIWTMSGFDINDDPLQFNGKNTGTILLRR